MKRSEVYLSRTEISLHLDLSRRLLLMKRGDTVIRRMVVGVGRPSSPTPRGRFAVTDKLSGYRYSAAYGCCIVALSAHQPNLPSGWTGGDRIAIHRTNVPSSIGVASRRAVRMPATRTCRRSCAAWRSAHPSSFGRRGYTPGIARSPTSRSSRKLLST